MQDQFKEQTKASNPEAEQKAMPEAAKFARTNGRGEVNVTLTDGRAVIVEVTHQGEPHPKGWSGVVVHHEGDRIDGHTRAVAVDAAIDYCRGMPTRLKVEEFVREKAQDTGQTSKNPEDVPPTAPISDSPQMAGGSVPDKFGGESGQPIPGQQS